MCDKWEAEQIRNAREHFQNFRAEFQDYGELQTLDWKDKDGSGECHVHYIFDAGQQCLFISGDLGYACFRTTWEPTLESMGGSLRDPWYIVGKIQCATDKYIYPQECVEKDVWEYYEDLRPQRYDYPYHEDGEEEWHRDVAAFEELIRAYIDAFDRNQGFCPQNFERLDEMLDLDPDLWENGFGKRIHTRVYLWLVDLDMARDQVKRMRPQQ